MKRINDLEVQNAILKTNFDNIKTDVEQLKAIVLKEAYSLVEKEIIDHYNVQTT